MMNILYKLDENGEVQPMEDTHEWCKWFAKAHKHIAQTYLDSPVNQERFYISTVFLAVNSGIGNTPVLFETMVFNETTDNILHGLTHKYHTKQEASEGHINVVKFLTKMLANEPPKSKAGTGDGY